MQRMLAVVVALAVIGIPVGAMAISPAPMAGRSGVAATTDTGLRAFMGAAASYDPSTRILTLTNGEKFVVAPHLSLEPLAKGMPFDGTYQIKNGKKVLEAFWIDVGQARGASL